MNGDELIKVEKLCFFRPPIAIKNLSFTLARGQCLALLGPNGTGKTTTLHLLAGLLQPQSGRIFIQGTDSQAQPPVRAQIGFLPDVLPLYGELTVQEYLRFVAKLRQLPNHQQEMAIDKALEKTDLKAYADHLIGILSKGLKQRVGIAQAILHEPEILLLDEPTQGLDVEQIQRFQQWLQAYKKKAAIILSTHYIQEVQAICDYALYFNQEGVMPYDFHHCPA